MVIGICLASAFPLLLLGMWHRMKLEGIVRSKVPKLAEEEFRVAVGYWVWNSMIPDAARRHHVRGTSAAATAMILAGAGFWQAGYHPLIPIILISGAVHALLDLVWQARKFERGRRTQAN